MYYIISGIKQFIYVYINLHTKWKRPIHYGCVFRFQVLLECLQPKKKKKRGEYMTEKRYDTH